MESRTKSRLAMLGILVAAGLLAVGAGMALGAEGVFDTAHKDVKAVVNGSDVRIYEDEMEVHNFTLPEGQNFTNYTWEISHDGNKIELHEREENEEFGDSHENELNETHIESDEQESLNGTHEAELEDSHEQGVNETHADELDEPHGSGASETQENETVELHGSQDIAQEPDAEHESGNESTPELAEQGDETQGSEAA